MQSITLMLSLKHCHGQWWQNPSINEWGFGRSKQVGALALISFSNLNHFCCRAWFFRLIDNLLWSMAHFHCCYLGYCLTHWLRISYDKQLSNAKAWSQTVVCEALDLSISLHTIITYYLIVWPASLIQYALLLAVHFTQDLNSVWFICRQFDSKCQVKSAAGHLLDWSWA